MDSVSAESLYLRRRVRESLIMAECASGPCARLAHETLARLFGKAIEALVARPTLHVVKANVPVSRSVSTEASHFRVASPKLVPAQRCVSAKLV